MVCTALSQHPKISPRVEPELRSRVLELFNASSGGLPGVGYRRERLYRLDRIGWFESGIPGFALHFDQLSSWLLYEILPAFNAKYIRLVRQGHLERYVSSCLAVRYNTWQRYDASSVPDMDPITISPENFLQVALREEKDWDEFDEMMQLPDDRQLEISYEGLCCDFGKEMQKICDFLGIDLRKNMKPQTVKISKKPALEYIANLDEVKDALKNTSFAIE